MRENLLKGSIFTEDRKKSKNDSVFRGIENDMYRFFAETAIENGYTDREKQYDMAEEVLNAIKKNGELLVEAGVGIGKTFAYLVPALLYSNVTKRPIAIATSTIALQEQLKGDVEEVARMLGIRVEAVIAKGQTHYICTEKARDYEGPEADVIREALAQGCLQRSEFNVDDATWEKVRVDRYSRKCVRTCDRPCGYHVLRSILPSAQVTICNQNLLTMHRLHISYGQSPILNKQIAINIIDEAHNLESKVRECTQTELKKGALISSIRSIVGSLHGYERDLITNDADSAIRAVEDFFQDVYHQMHIQDAESETEIERYYFRDEKNLLHKMQKRISAFYDRAEIYLSFDESRTEVDDLEDAANSLEDLLDDIEGYVCWIEKRGAFCFCRENIAEIVADHYFSYGCPVCILTSATLTNRADGSLQDQYDYLMKSIGFDGFLSEPKDSPFNYDEHAMIYVADRLPHPTKEHDEFIRQGTQRLKEILQISKGRALVLFTAKKDMMEVYDELQKDCPYEIIIQKAGASQQETLNKFRKNEHAVLLGTGTYWEGINIEGQTLSNVIIFRLPFPVPDPVIDSREKHAKNPLMEVKVPEMVLRLKQGVGRLIRSESDKGIISIIDSRVGESSRAPYKEIVWNSLPIKNRTGSLEEIRRFYRDVVLEGEDPEDHPLNIRKDQYDSQMAQEEIIEPTVTLPAFKAQELEALCNEKVPEVFGLMEEAGVSCLDKALDYFDNYLNQDNTRGYIFPIDVGAMTVYFTYKWRVFRAIYSFDTTLINALIDQAEYEDAGEGVPVEALSRLPYDCISLKLPPMKLYMHQYSEEVNLTGDAIVTLEPHEGNIKSLFVAWVDDHDAIITSHFLLIPDSSIGNCYEEQIRDLLNSQNSGLGNTLISEAKSSGSIGASYKIGDISKLEKSLLAATENDPENRLLINYAIDSLKLSKIVIQCILYLNSAEPDIEDILEKIPNREYSSLPGNTQTQSKKGNVTIKDVGYNIGNIIRREMQKAREEAARHDAVSDRNKIRAYIRRGHWHHYWKGPRNGKIANDHKNPLPGERYLLLKYRCPEFVAGITDKATVFRVKKPVLQNPAI